MRDLSRVRLFTVSVFLLLLGLAGPAAARLVGPFSAVAELGGSDAVYKVQVIAVRTDGTAPGAELGAYSGGPLGNLFERGIAECRVLSVLKGDNVSTVAVQYPGEVRRGVIINGPGPVHLSPGEVILLFLRRSGDRWRIRNLDYPKMRTTTRIAAFPPDATPRERLLAELMTAARDPDPAVYGLAFSQMAQWIDTLQRYRTPADQASPDHDAVFRPEVRRFLDQRMASPDPVVRGLVALVSVRAGWSPGTDRAIAILRSVGGASTPSADFVFFGGGRAGPIAELLIADIAASAKQTTRVSTVARLKPQITRRGGLEGFDYVAFGRAALHTDVVKRSSDLRFKLNDMLWRVQGGNPPVGGNPPAGGLALPPAGTLALPPAGALALPPVGGLS